jgi:hypothetical protein
MQYILIQETDANKGKNPGKKLSANPAKLEETILSLRG